MWCEALVRLSAAAFSFSKPPSASALRASSMASSAVFTSDSASFSRLSFTTFSVWYTRLSSRLRASTSESRALSSAACESASFFMRQASGSGDGDLLFLARRVVLRRDVQNAVRVNIKRHLHLRHSTRSRRQSHQVEFTE